MAEVFAATDSRLGRPVAVKILRKDLANDATFQGRFRREAQSAASLNHPNIVSIYDTGEEFDPVVGLSVPYIVMELVEGHTLREILRDGRKILPERALEFTQGVLDALSYSHKAGIIHRDIKPANVMLTPQGQVKVMDFGIARAVADTSATMTQTAAVIGTAQYLSPEQARGETVDARSDLYSAGCLMYELLTGRPPFVGDSPVSVAYQHVREMPAPPSSIDPMITPEIDAITMKSLAKNPADRYQSAREMRDDIGRLLAGLEVTAQLTPATAAVAGSTPSEYADRDASLVAAGEDDAEPETPKKKKALPIVLVALAVLLVAGLIGGAVWWNSRPKGPVMLTVPVVVGEQRVSAENSVRNDGFRPRTSEVNGTDDNTVGTVTKQTPAGGQPAAQGSEVLLEVNIGPQKIAIPSDLVGQKKDDVMRKLRDAGFTNVTAVAANSEPRDAQPDQVLSIDPGSGTQATADTAIHVNYASGRSQVPDWRGWNRSSVTSDAADRGFSNITFGFRRVTDQTQDGTVLATDPQAGTTVLRTAEIKVTLGRYEQPTPTPTPTQQQQPPQPQPPAPPATTQNTTAPRTEPTPAPSTQSHEPTPEPTPS
ncbi:Stk1 family PASTA domain-containing Ser/Thr kinase [Granulicoccus phenolivorans]